MHGNLLLTTTINLGVRELERVISITLEGKKLILLWKEHKILQEQN